LENQNFHEDDVAAYRTLSFKEASLLATTHWLPWWVYKFYRFVIP
jgi:hypothetical protein